MVNILQENTDGIRGHVNLNAKTSPQAINEGDCIGHSNCHAEKRLEQLQNVAKNEAHFSKFNMFREIQEQQETIELSLNQQPADLIKASEFITNADNIYISACGTSLNAAYLGSHMLSHISKYDSKVMIGSEFKYSYERLDPNCVLLALSQSGETSDIVNSVRHARSEGCKIISFVTNQNSTLGKLSDLVLPLRCGEELAVAATKSYTAQITIMTLISHYINGTHQQLIRDIKTTIPNIVSLCSNTQSAIYEASLLLCQQKACYFVGRGCNRITASEAALKLKEVSYIHSEGLSAGELIHGTLATIEEGTLLFSICPSDDTFGDTISDISYAKGKGAYIIGISDVEHQVFDKWISIPKASECLYPLLSIIPLQKLAFFSALAKCVNPDSPRNLTKIVSTSQETTKRQHSNGI